jgi:cytochrome c-type biogenesis protein CcmF
MPWLVGTALIHSLAVTEKRGAFKAWTVLLAIFAFSLSLLGTFLVRSGVLTSVHAFATDPARGVFILAFLVVVIGASLALFAWRAPRVGLGGSFEAVSRESMLLGNNVLLAVACGTVLLGTLYPLFLDALGLGKISVGPPYFDAVFVPVMAPLVFLMGIGPIARWKSASLPDLWTRLKWALMISLVLGMTLPFVGKVQDGIAWSPMAAFGYWMAAWIVVASIEQIRSQIRHAPGGLLARLAVQPRGWWGMTLAHLGVAAFIIGVTSVKGFEIERDVKMSPGDTVGVHGYTFRFDGVGERRGPNFNAARGTVTLIKNGKEIDVLHPEKRIYLAQSQMPMTEASIRTGITGDVYVSLGEPVEPAGSWTVRVYYKPFVTWIWGGCTLMALGGFLAASDRRYRTLAQRHKAIATGGRQPAAA